MLHPMCYFSLPTDGWGDDTGGKVLPVHEDWSLDPLTPAEISGGHGGLAIIPEEREVEARNPQSKLAS